MRIVCIIDTLAIKLRFVCKHDVTMQLATAIEPLAKVQPLIKIVRSEMLHSLHVVWIHALCMQCSPQSRVWNTKTSCNSSRTHTCVMNGQGVVLSKNYKTEVKQYFVYSELNSNIINN